MANGDRSATGRRLIIDETATDQWFIGDRSAIGLRTIADRLEGGFKNARLIAERLPTNHAAPTGRHSIATSRREVADLSLTVVADHSKLHSKQVKRSNI